MKTFLKILGGIVLLFICLILIGAGYIHFSGIPSYEVELPEYSINSTPEKVAEGKRLASMLCVNCHYNETTGKLSGERMLDAPEEFGIIHSANITSDIDVGIGSWTDAEILYLLRTGIKRDGKYAPPYMAKLPHMSDDDIESIICFLRSSDKLVQPDPTPSVPVQPGFLTKFLCQVAFKPLPMPKGTVAPPDTSNSIELGRYLVFNLDCFGCHSASFETMNTMEPEKSVGFFGGGNPVLDKNGNLIPSANLTPHEETGIGSWTEEQFVNRLRSGVMEGKVPFRYPMTPYPALTEKEASAIYAYLQTVPPIENKVE